MAQVLLRAQQLRSHHLCIRMQELQIGFVGGCLSVFTCSVSADLQISLARHCHGDYITALCLLTAFGMAFFSILRTKADPGTGILTVLGYCVSILSGELAWPAHTLWREVLLSFVV